MEIKDGLGERNTRMEEQTNQQEMGQEVVPTMVGAKSTLPGKIAMLQE